MREVCVEFHSSAALAGLLFERADGIEHCRQGLLADQQHLLGVQIEVLVSDHIAETHGSLPIDVREPGSQQARLKLLQPLEGLPCREELHADDIEQVLAFFAVQQRRIGEQGRSLALDPLQCLPEGA